MHVTYQPLCFYLSLRHTLNLESRLYHMSVKDDETKQGGTVKIVCSQKTGE